jgi:hypothetical protein
MVLYYRFETSLVDIEPKIYRTFALPFDATFFDLHSAIQMACGWQNYHSYMFQNEDEEDLAKPYSSEFDEASTEGEDENIPDDVALQLSSYFQDGSKIERCFYIYDLRDYWLHTVTLQRVIEEDTVFLRKLLDGDGAFPREDCGGVQGYKELLTLKETGKIPNTVDWSDAANIVELLENWAPNNFDFDKTKAFFDLPAHFQKKSA